MFEIQKKKKLTLSSKAPTPIPAVAPEPGKPIKCSLPILLTKSDIPTFEVKIQFEIEIQ